MEGLIRLVAESFVRHGLEVEPVADLQGNLQVGSRTGEPSARPTSAPPTKALPEHNYRKMLEVDFARKA
jgi:hypothetical protein